MRSQRTLSNGSLPLSGMPNMHSELIQSPFPLSLSSASSNSPLTPALLCSVLGAELRPIIPQLTSKFRASSCQPLGRLLLNSAESSWLCSESARNEDDAPLDLSNKSPNKTTPESPLEVTKCMATTIIGSIPTPSTVSIPTVQDSSESETRSIPALQTNKSSVARRRRTTASRRSRKPNRPEHHLSAEQDLVSQPSMDTNLFSAGQPASQSRYPTMSDTEDYRITTSSGTTGTVPRVRGRRSHSASDTPLAQIDKPNRMSDEAAGSDVSTISDTHWSLNRPTAIIQTRRTSSSSGTNTARPGSDPNICNPRMRRYPEMTPTEAKDQAYWEKRVKNNEAARRSRRARKSKEQSLRDYAERLEKVNTQLLEEIKLLKKEVVRLKSKGGQKNGDEQE
ncbi:putative par domain protein [Fasciola gigantica]|uniref:Putative par domain protein n=1 Tax=Fasciola gigantica TaxID=46835 RepID=A0A504Y9Q1_FASGI|nr:putative par domain protein [Fasciola gigantica]